MVTIAPSSASRRKSTGMAVISFDLAFVATCPSTTPLVVAQALTRGRAALPARRSCGLPSPRMGGPPQRLAIERDLLPARVTHDRSPPVHEAAPKLLRVQPGEHP